MMRWFVEADWEMRLCRDRPARGRPLPVRGGDRRQEVGRLGHFLEVRPPERLVYTWIWETRLRLRRSPGDTQVTVEFRESGADTEIVLTHERFDSVRAREDHADGWKTCLDRIERLVERMTKEDTMRTHAKARDGTGPGAARVPRPPAPRNARSGTG